MQLHTMPNTDGWSRAIRADTFGVALFAGREGHLEAVSHANYLLTLDRRVLNKSHASWRQVNRVLSELPSIPTPPAPKAA
jgi:hypothetical protein